MEAIWLLDLFVNVGIQIWALDQHRSDLDHQITLEREGRFFAKNRQKIGDKSLINRRHTGFSGDFIKKSPIYPVSPIFWRFFAKNLPADLSPPFIVSPPADTRYIGDISPIFGDFFLLVREIVMKGDVVVEKIAYVKKLVDPFTKI